jgi:hypothetical protein
MNLTKVHLSCSTSQPRSIASLRPALYSAGGALSKQERPVDQLDVDPAVLYGFDAIGDLQQLADGLLGIGPRAG